MASSNSTRRPLPRVIAVANQKGGVGKTTTTINLGACLAELGYRTLIVDLDPQGNASTGLGIDTRGLETSMYDVIMREVPLDQCIEPSSVKNLFVAPASLDLAGSEIELVPAFSRENRLRNAITAVLDVDRRRRTATRRPRRRPARQPRRPPRADRAAAPRRRRRSRAAGGVTSRRSRPRAISGKK